MANRQKETSQTGNCSLTFLFAYTVRTLRKKQDISQELLAEKAGLDRSYISLLERGKKCASLSTLEKIGVVLCGSVAEFLTRYQENIYANCTYMIQSGRCPRVNDPGHRYPCSTEAVEVRNS